MGLQCDEKNILRSVFAGIVVRSRLAAPVVMAEIEISNLEPADFVRCLTKRLLIRRPQCPVNYQPHSPFIDLYIASLALAM